MKPIAKVMSNTLAYRLVQAPFAEKKLAVIRDHNDLSAVRCVLDVGCGPGTNTHHFEAARYLGVDLNPGYLASARRRHGRSFVAANVTTAFLRDSRFDFILLNSLLHHLDRPSVRNTLHWLSGLLEDDGHIHILDLVLPDKPGIDRMLARLDRGDFPRRLEEWRELFADQFEPVVFEPYPLGTMGVTMWNMVYFKGASRRA